MKNVVTKKNEKNVVVKKIDVVAPAKEYKKGEDPLMLRQEMIACSDEGKPMGGVDVGAGLGSDGIRLYWKDRVVMIRGRDLLIAWIATFDQEGAAALREKS